MNYYSSLLAASIVMALSASAQASNLIVDGERYNPKPSQPLVVEGTANARVVPLYHSEVKNTNTYKANSAQQDTRELILDPKKAEPMAVKMPPLGPQGKVFHQGHRVLASDKTLRGWADAVPLSVALVQVIPADWKTERQGINESKVVSWKGDRSWSLVLEDIAKLGGIEATVLWDTKTVRLTPVGKSWVESAPLKESVPPLRQSALVAASPVPPAKSGANLYYSNDLGRDSGLPKNTDGAVAFSPVTPPAFVAPPVPVAIPVVEKIWNVEPTKTLRENVESWAKKENWTVVWEGADYPIVSRAGFKGDFISQEGPLATLISAYDLSEQPLNVRVLGKSRVIHVTNRNFSATRVENVGAMSLAPKSLQLNSRGE